MKLVKLINYNITFEPDLRKFKFRGTERIKLVINKPTNRLVLNSAELKIKICSLPWRGRILKPSIKLNKKEELILKFKEKISGKVKLFIEFEGILNDKLVGFYRSKYHVNGKEKHLATTQFEAVDARRAFPCWDNPGDKATFGVSVVIDKKLTAISNMPIIEERKISKNKKIVRFARTPIMTTYLLYLGVGEFEFIKTKLGKTLIRVATTPRKKNQGKFALECAKKFLKFYQDYFQIKYPLPKLDLIALPDFASGAMENWGAITFRESALLYDPKISSLATKQRIAEIIAHELVHQWFGNLVTMRWWNDLWLNESFATFMANKPLHKFYPDWEVWSQFLHDAVDDALRFDALKTSHRIEVDVREPSEIQQIFDQISYDKGGSILRMLENYMGEKMFRQSLNKYLKKHKYGNAMTDDLLWSVLGKISHKPITKMMNGWVRQTGYPLIEANVEGSKLILTQKRFLLEKTKTKEQWLVPISIKLKEKDISYLLTKKKASINIKNGWFKINSGQTGFYRVRYPKQVLNELKKLVSKKELSSADRWGIQNDLFALTLSEEVSIKEYLDFLDAYSNEDDYVTCASIEENLYYIYLITSKEKFWPKIKKYNKRFLRKVFARLGWEIKKNEKHTDTLLRMKTIVYLGRLEDEEILRTSREKFREFLKKPDSLHPDLRSAVYHSVAWSGDGDVHKKFIKLYNKAKTQEEKKRFLDALASFQDKKLLNKTLQFAVSPNVRSQDLMFPVAFAAINPYGLDVVWPQVKKNWKKIATKLGKTKILLSRLIGSMSGIADVKVAEDMKRFFRKAKTPGVDRAVAQTVEKIRINSRFLERIRKEY